MKAYLNSVKKALAVFVAVAALAVVATELIYNQMATYESMNCQERAIMFFYRTNVPGGQASAWQLALADKHPEIKYLEIQCFDLIEQSGLNANGLPSSTSGWQIISTRMSQGECDILVLDRERYEFMLSKGHLMPMEQGLIQNREVMANNTVMGYDISGMKLDGLEFPCLIEPHNRVESTSEASSEVILCLLKDARPAAAELAKKILQGAVELPKPQDMPQGSGSK